MTATEDVHEGLVAELVHQAISRGLDQLTNERDGKWPIRAEFTVEKGQQAIEKTVQVHLLWYLVQNVCVYVGLGFE